MTEEDTSEKKKTLYCSFCGKSQHEVEKLVAGQKVFICSECIDICDDIVWGSYSEDSGRFSVRIKTKSNSPQLNDLFYSAIVEFVSEEFPDCNLEYVNKTPLPKSDQDEEDLNIIRFSMVLPPDLRIPSGKDVPPNLREQINETVQMLQKQLSEKVSELSVVTKQFTNATSRVEQLENELSEIKHEYLDFLRERKARIVSAKELRSVLFLDIVGFSKISETRKQAIVDLLRGLAPTLLGGSGAANINMWGDAIVSTFADPNECLKTAVKFVRHLSVEKMDARIGIAWGEVRLSYNAATSRDDLDGECVDLAARIEPMANVGEVLVSNDFGSLNINSDEFTLVPVRRKIGKAFAQYNIGDEIELFSVSYLSN